MIAVCYHGGIAARTVFAEVGWTERHAGKRSAISMTFSCSHFQFWTGAVKLELDLGHHRCTMCANI